MKGFVFSGICADTKFRGTSFETISSRGLLLEQGTTIGRQGDPNVDNFLPGNIWTNGAGAEHQGSFAEINLSLIHFDPNIPNTFPNPIPIPGSGWFIPNNDLPTIDCGLQPDCEIDEENLTDPTTDEVDIKIASGELTPDIFEGGILREGERYFYRKINQYGLIGQSSIVDSFYNANTNTSIGQFHEIDDDKATLYDSNDPLLISITDKRDSVQNTLVLLKEKDSLLSVLPENEHPPILLEKQAILQQLSGLSQDLNSLLSSFNSAKQLAVDNIETQNSNIAVAEVFEQNRKTINEIYLNTIALGTVMFDPVQLTQVENIAGQCPLSGGNAVFEARGMLKMVKDTTFNDTDICDRVEPRSNDNKDTDVIISSGEIKVYPNPTKGTIHLELNRETESNREFLLYDMTGKFVTSYLIPKGQKRVNFNIVTLQSGIYYYKCKLEEGTSNGKIILIK